MFYMARGIGAWLVAGWQLSLGFALGLPFAYLLAAIVLTLGLLIVGLRFAWYPLAFLGGEIEGGAMPTMTDPPAGSATAMAA